MNLKLLPSRITNRSPGWTIHIDDGHVSYEFQPDLKNCSIQDVANAILKMMKQCPKCKRENYVLNVMLDICTWCGYTTKAEEPTRRQTATEQVCGSEAERRIDEKHSDPTAGISESPKQK